MADEPSEGKTVCLYSHEHFVTLKVSSKATQEEVQNVNLRRASLPTKHLSVPGPTTETRLGTSFVSLDSMLCCIACPRSDLQFSRDIEYSCDAKVFDPTTPELKFERPFPQMKQPRFHPAVTVIGGIIYVFGGIVLHKEHGRDYIWSEYLDTNLPKDNQEWVTLNPHPSLPLALLRPYAYAVAYGHNNILVFGGNIAENAVLYNLEDGSWNDKKKLDDDGSYMPAVTYPVFVDQDSIMYWLSGYYFYAYDLNTKVVTHGRICNSVLYDMSEYELEDSFLYNGLMHLRDDVFCFFTMASRLRLVDRILECTKFRVTKRLQYLQIDVFGYQSYVCDGLRNIFGGVSIGSCFDGLMEPPTKKLKHENDKDKSWIS